MPDWIHASRCLIECYASCCVSDIHHKTHPSELFWHFLQSRSLTWRITTLSEGVVEASNEELKNLANVFDLIGLRLRSSGTSREVCVSQSASIYL